jgi:hypothetical protein
MCGNCAHEWWRHGRLADGQLACLHFWPHPCPCDGFIQTSFELVPASDAVDPSADDTGTPSTRVGKA